MNNHIIISIISAILFTLSKFLETKYIKKEDKPLKELFLDGLIILVIVFLTLSIVEQFDLDNMISGDTSKLFAFTSEPDF